MRYILATIMTVISFVSANAYEYSYSFNNTPISEAIVRISKDHPDVNIFFIYKELDNYKTSAKVNSDNAYQALRQTIGANPVSIMSKGDRYYIEALQHGKFRYHGSVINEEKESVTGVSVMLLSPRDSTVISYCVTDSNGRFSIPCDNKNILAKFVCIGYRTIYINKPQFAMGTIEMQQAPIQFSTVSVEADNTIFFTDKNIYIPTSSQKNAAQDAADLLRRMAIPQLVINPDDNSVKDVFGNSLPIFINYHEAAADELKGMKMTDVRKIEFIEFPTDPRFKGEQRVVNFIVQEYEYGGYAKVSGSIRTLNGMFSNTDVFCRLTYKKMTYDVYAGSDNQDFHHAGSDNSAIYRLENDGEQISLNRREVFNESASKSNKYQVTFRSTYNTPRFTVRNTLYFTHFSSPDQLTSGDLDVSIHSENDYTFTRRTPNRNNTIFYHSNLWGTLGSNGSFDITPSFNHTHRNNAYIYESTMMQEPVDNLITENTYNWGVQATGRLVFAQNNQLALHINGGQNINKLVYRGTSDVDDSYYNCFGGGILQYRYQTKKLSIISFIGFNFNHNSMNGITTNDASPRIGTNARISLNKKSQISAYLLYGTTTPGISMKANDIVRNNEFIYLTGNPYLKNWKNLNSNLSYNRYYNNSLSLTVFAGYEQDFNRVATIYRPYDDGKALLRDFLNDGSFIHYYSGISANYKLFKNSLQLYANLTQNAYEITGSQNDSYYPFRVQLQAAYYWKTFNILASWGNPPRSLTKNSNYIIRGRNFHMLSVGWGNGIWNINLAARNIFNKGWFSETWENDTPLYSEFRQVYNPSAHTAINLSITYTVGYGKKIQRGNEVRGTDSAPSAIADSYLR